MSALLLALQILGLALLAWCAVNGLVRLLYLLAPEDEGRG